MCLSCLRAQGCKFFGWIHRGVAGAGGPVGRSRVPDLPILLACGHRDRVWATVPLVPALEIPRCSECQSGLRLAGNFYSMLRPYST
jgi:hypothetical protein